MIMRVVKFEELEKEMELGDIILFNGKYKGSKVIEFFEGSQWSHVGMVVRLEAFDGPLIWEATSLTNIPDVIFHDHKVGVKLVSLKKRLEHYGDDLKPFELCNFGYRKFNIHRTEKLRNQFKGLIERYHGIPDPSFWKMIIDVIKGRIFKISVPLDKYFCSELIAKTYMELGFISEEKPINGYMPADFSKDSYLKLIEGFFDEEVLIDIKHI